MNKYIYPAFSLIILLTSICFSADKKKSDPDKTVAVGKTNMENIMAQESLQDLPVAQFYKLEESIEDIQKQIAQLKIRVMEYEKKSPETNYSEKLKKLIDEYYAAHKIILKNGSIILGTIETDRVEDIMVNTKVGKLTIEKKEIEFIEDLIIPEPQIIFIGHGKEQVFDNYHLFTGKVMNQGGRRGDFVRVIYQLWGENTQVISSDSVFVAGTQVKYKSGIITDTALEPNQSVQFSVQVEIVGEIPVSYVTREVSWLTYD